jgi:COMPASS component BRE2
MYISLPSIRKADDNDPHDSAHVKRERIPIEFKGQEYFESLEYPVTKEMVALMDYSNKASSSAPAPPSLKKSATVKNLPKHGRGAKSPAMVDPLRPLSTLPGSFIAFFVNGECQGIAFHDLYDYLPLCSTGASRKAKEKKRARDGAREHKENPFDDGTLGYYPFISLFNHARARVNPGPDFAYPPPLDIDALLRGKKSANERTWRPILERYPEYMAEQWALDEKEEEEAKVEAIHRATQEKVEAAKKAQRDKKREQAAADAAAMQTDDDRPTSMTTFNLPLHNLQRFELGDRIYSPAPTVASSVDMHNPQSGYTSDHLEGEAENGHAHEREVDGLRTTDD